MLSFSCSVCAPKSNISQHEAYGPLAISFSHRAKVTWLTTVSHLTMQKDYQFVALLSSGDAPSYRSSFTDPSSWRAVDSQVVHPSLFRACRVLLWFSCLLHACLITPVKKKDRTDPGWFLALLQGWVPHLLPLILLSPSLPQQWSIQVVGYWTLVILLLHSGLYSCFASGTAKENEEAWSWDDKIVYKEKNPHDSLQRRSKLYCHDS